MEDKVAEHTLWTSKNKERSGLPETKISPEVEKKVADAFEKKADHQECLRPFQTLFEESDLAKILA